MNSGARDSFSSSPLGEQGHWWHKFQGAMFCQGGPEDMTDSRRDSPKGKQIRTQKTICSLFVTIIIIMHFFHRTLKLWGITIITLKCKIYMTYYWIHVLIEEWLKKKELPLLLLFFFLRFRLWAVLYQRYISHDFFYDESLKE